MDQPQTDEAAARIGAEADEQSGLVLPPLCADLKFWVVSGYTETSPATKSHS